MLKFGIISNIDEKTARARVTFPDMDDHVSNPLPVIFPFTGNDKSYGLPSEGDQVACVMDENFEDGCIIGSPYSDEDTVNIADKNKFYKKFADGTYIEYDKKEHILTADVKGICDLKAITVNITAVNINSTGFWSHSGALICTGNISSGAGVTDSVGFISQVRSIFNSHNHQGDSGGTTGNPNQQM